MPEELASVRISPSSRYLIVFDTKITQAVITEPMENESAQRGLKGAVCTTCCDIRLTL